MNEEFENSLVGISIGIIVFILVGYGLKISIRAPNNTNTRNEGPILV